jgi:hypothetical protein
MWQRYWTALLAATTKMSRLARLSIDSRVNPRQVSLRDLPAMAPLHFDDCFTPDGDAVWPQAAE